MENLAIDLVLAFPLSYKDISAADDEGRCWPYKQQPKSPWAFTAHLCPPVCMYSQLGLRAERDETSVFAFEQDRDSTALFLRCQAYSQGKEKRRKGGRQNSPIALTEV